MSRAVLPRSARRWQRRQDLDGDLFRLLVVGQTEDALEGILRVIAANANHTLLCRNGGAVGERAGQSSALFPLVSIVIVANQHVDRIVPLLFVFPNRQRKISTSGNDQDIFLLPISNDRSFVDSRERSSDPQFIRQ